MFENHLLENVRVARINIYSYHVVNTLFISVESALT